jgi:DNA polymerase III delta prime subunit
VVDIKSKLLKESLMEIMKDVQGETLEADEPCIDPNMLFLFLEDIRTYYKKTLKSRLKKEKKRKSKKRVKGMISHCRVLCKYLDEDYEETKKTLYPLLKAGNITFDLLWALFKPNTIAYTSTYNDHDNPRCFKVDRTTKEQSFMRGEWYSVEGRYLEYDGKNYGLGDFEAQVDQFKGSRKITSLSTYPLQYHKDPEAVKKQLVDRGKQFVSMTGMNYRFHKGMAFQKKRKGVAKFNINGRVMIDPATFRRINPNYAISLIKPKDDDDEETDSEDDCGCGGDSDGGDNNNPLQMGAEEKEELPKTKFKVVLDPDPKNKKRPIVVEVPIDENGKELARPEKLDAIVSDVETGRVFTEEELLIASPVVLGFAFSEKAWLEFSLSGVREIEWNERAYESLVLPKNQKHVVKALVSSHKFHAAETIDDVVQGKGRGLVFVLHGPPGVGKTLTAEGVAEDLRCPLYAVSMGELGTDSNRLEIMLQQVMDIAHSWGAVLLLDEADVFLEKRQHQDVHRNALVSIFLRLLEYFQGILFLTTNRVQTFDEAFQSRIHVALKYEELTQSAQMKVWKEFIEKVRIMQGIDVMPFTDANYDYLARRRLNGRQIKNAVRTAQALALHEDSKLSMKHIERVLEVAESFEQDLKGGSGYLEAMRSYT